MPAKQNASDFIGLKYGMLTIIKDLGSGKNSKRIVETICECGNVKITDLNSLRTGNIKSCGCIHKSMPNDYLGRKYGKLIIIYFLGYINGKSRFIVLCECGNKKNMTLDGLKSGKTSSCGCIKKTKNGLTKHPLHKVWLHMIDRCYNFNNEKYHRYGGIGVVVCEEWKNDYVKFYEWGIVRWQKELQIDKDILSPYKTGRLYSPNFCCFVTATENSRNRSNNRILEYKGSKKCIAEWAEELHISRDVIKGRLKLGWPIERIFEEPINKK